MAIEKVTLCLNTDDPEQKELFEFITELPNGKRRNASAFLKTIADRFYQKRKERYLVDKEEHEKKTQRASMKTEKGGIRYTLSNQDIHKNAD